MGWPRITNRRELSLRRLESKSSRLCSKNLEDDRNKERVVKTLEINIEKHVAMSWTLTMLKQENRDIMLLASKLFKLHSGERKLLLCLNMNGEWLFQLVLGLARHEAADSVQFAHWYANFMQQVTAKPIQTTHAKNQFSKIKYYCGHIQGIFQSSKI